MKKHEKAIRRGKFKIVYTDYQDHFDEKQRKVFLEQNPHADEREIAIFLPEMIRMTAKQIDNLKLNTEMISVLWNLHDFSQERGFTTAEPKIARALEGRGLVETNYKYASGSYLDCWLVEDDRYEQAINNKKVKKIDSKKRIAGAVRAKSHSELSKKSKGRAGRVIVG